MAGNEKYVNYYIDTLTSTLTDCVIRNISLQVNARISDEAIEELKKTNDELVKSYNDLTDSTKNSENENIKRLTHLTETQKQTIDILNSEISMLNRMKGEFESVKSKANNVDAFRNELVKERESHQQTKKQFEIVIGELNKQIELLQVPPKKKKPVKVEPLTTTEQNTVSPDDAVKDGGSF